MKRPALAEIVEALHKAGIPPQLSADQSRLLIRILQLVATGCPVSSEQLREIASALHMPLDDANFFLKQVSEIDESGNVVGILGLSQKKHSHRFQVNGHILSTWCAWDTLFLPALLKHSAKVESVCPITKSRILVTLSPDRVEHHEQLKRYFPSCYQNRTRRVRNPPRKSGRSFATMYFSSVLPRRLQNGLEERSTIVLFCR
jgi:Alkylmercury lyase